MKNPLRTLRLRLGAFAEKSLDASRSPLLRRLHELEQQAGEQGRCLEVFTFMKWIRHATITTTPLISVVLPTRDRRERLERAIASVVRQTYSNWQLVVVDDGSVDTTSDFLARLDDTANKMRQGWRARHLRRAQHRARADGGRDHRLSRR